MFTGRYEGIPGEDRNITPSYWQSMGDSFSADYLTPYTLLPQSEPGEREALQNRIRAMQDVADSGDQSLVQKSANWIAGMAGMTMNPLNVLAGEGLGTVASKLLPAGAGLLGRYLPVPEALGLALMGKKRINQFIGENVPKFVGEKTVGDIAQGGISGFSTVTGFSLPQEIANTYNPRDNSFNWWGGIKSASADGGAGLLLMSVPYLAGTIWGKMFGESVDHTKMPPSQSAKPPAGTPPSAPPIHPAIGQVQIALQQGKITHDFAQWFTDYLTGKETNETLSKRAVELLIKDGHPVDAATQKVLFKIFTPEEINQLHTAIADALASPANKSTKKLFTDFLLNKKLDELQKNNKILNGLHGVIQFIRNRLSRTPEEHINLQKILRKLLPENVKAGNPFAQQKLYRAIKAGKRFSASVPKQVSRKLQQEQKIKTEQQRLANYHLELNKTGRNKYKRLIQKTETKITNLQQNIQPLLSHTEEITHIRDKLMPQGKVIDNFKLTPEYERLLDLTRVKNDARRLLHEVHVNHEYQMHEHYANFLEAITDVMQSSVTNLAKPENVINYMRERLKHDVPEIEKVTKPTPTQAQEPLVKKPVSTESPEQATASTKTDNDSVLKTFDEKLKDAPAEIQEEYNTIKNQFKEFNESQSVFKSLIKCVEGTING